MCIEEAPVAWLEIDHGSDVNIAESDGKAAMSRSLGRAEFSSRDSFSISAIPLDEPGAAIAQNMENL
jgi:hypothetical protein